VIIGGLGIFVAWTVLRAWRSGVLFSQGVGYDVNENPALYGFGILCHLGIVVFCAALAAGYLPSELWQFVRR
jgi:hypothetical protein